MDGGGRLLEPITAAAAGVGAHFGAPAMAPGRRAAALLSTLTLDGRRFARRRPVSAPAARRLPRLLGTGLTFAFFGSVAITGCILGGHDRAFREQYGEPHHLLARALGLGVERVTISGIDRLTEAEVLAAAGISPATSLPFLSVSETRERLQRTPLIQGASVRKLYPNALAITLTERQPFALWQRNGELFVVAADGTVIDTMRDDRFVDLPLVVGEEANGRAKEYLGLLEAAGALKSRIRAGSLVSGRRWTLKMQNGTDVRLPEIGATEAVTRLVRLEREHRILDKDVIAIDLRMRDRVVVRLTEEAAAARADSLKKKPIRGKGVET
jgi:cell division protein FtsQ